ncbi:MAG: hypothetical protein J6S57_00030 [Alphaproteobacteria bacterium]|nr:hypothetical protein [Alphaproteobacteria bacterium]
MKWYVYIIFCFLVLVMPAFADNVTTINTTSDINTVELPVDSAALNFAIEKMSDADAVKNVMYVNILSQKRLTTGKLVELCCDVADATECALFVKEYVNILTDRSNCTKANNYKIYDLYNKDEDRKIKVSTIQECYSRATVNDYVPGSIVDQCKQWIDAAEKCQIYLIYYYKDKLLNTDISKRDQKKYKCILDKLESGNMTVPTSEMEKECSRL